jgi:hypothetical protein
VAWLPCTALRLGIPVPSHEVHRERTDAPGDLDLGKWLESDRADRIGRFLWTTLVVLAVLALAVVVSLGLVLTVAGSDTL